MALAANLTVTNPGKGVEEPGVFVGVSFEGVSECDGIEIDQELDEIGCGKLEGSLVELVAILVADEIEGELLPEAGPLDPLLVSEPVLVAATSPVPEIGFGDTMGIWAEFLKDVGVGKAIEEHVVDAVADCFGKPGDFALALPASGKGEG